MECYIPNDIVSKEKYDLNPNRCAHCGNCIPFSKRASERSRRFCNRSCAASFNNQTGIAPKRSVAEKQVCINCCQGLGKNAKTYCSYKCQHAFEWKLFVEEFEKGSNPSEGLARKYLLKTQEHECNLCRRTEWENQPIPLEMDHISGDSTDNRLANVRLLCCNCHALTPTYKARNRGNGRAQRRARYRDGLSW